MCGRTACTLAPDEVSRASVYRNRGGRRRQPRWRDGDADKYRPSYNKSPQSMSPVLLSRRHFDEDAAVDECVLTSMRWGLVPAWFKEKDPSMMQFSTNNCRSESILEKKSYKDPLIKGQRCVILADGFYEWKKQEKDKQPFFIYFPQSQEKTKAQDDPTTSSGNKDNSETMCSKVQASPELTEEEDAQGEWTGWKLLTMAGVFDCWTPPGGGEALYTYSVITVKASPNLQSIHNRMPAILDGEEEVRRWLDFGKVKSLDALKLLESKNILTFHPVSSLVNNSRHNSPECLQPVDPNSKKEPKPTASSRKMASWLKSSAPSKRKEPDTRESKEDKKRKPTGGLQPWLQGVSKKPRTT
ncbi:abasic site processing protein HMCES [Labrus mixtus]|uniref:abasic site processing protein HMCES n=1 Tax=Labrus mixtus TaxID=508554 RepID=UPI0029C003E8|nr:abasic site processing protein HMCES [Labrus mixtus]